MPLLFYIAYHILLRVGDVNFQNLVAEDRRVMKNTKLLSSLLVRMI